MKHSLKSQEKTLPNARLDMAIAAEAARLSDKYEKDVFDCDDLVKILGLGKNNVRELMNSREFPTKTVGARKFVTPLGLSAWMAKEFYQNT
jgi:hypothetical protein